jgi:hypothetical protein
MKKIILLAMSVYTLTVCAQESKTWRLGASFGMNNNRAKFSGGTPEANARFHQNPFGTAGLDFLARYDYDNHWMAMFGLGFTSTGYEFALSENYSLLNKSKQFSTIISDFGKFEMPVMFFYKFNPNCKNARWLIGGGFVPTLIEEKNINRSFDKTNEGNTNSNYLNSNVTSKGGGYMLLRWSVAREKMFKNGSMLNAALIFNVGFSEMTKANVKYIVDNQSYEHNFTSNGNFVGLRFSYFLKPIGSNKIKAKQQATAK